MGFFKKIGPIGVAMACLLFTGSCTHESEIDVGNNFFDFSPGQYFKYELTGYNDLQGNGSYILYVDEHPNEDDALLIEWEAKYQSSGEEPLKIVSRDKVRNAKEAQFILGLLPPGIVSQVIDRSLMQPHKYVQDIGSSWSEGDSRNTTLMGESVSMNIVGTCSYSGIDGLLGQWLKDDELLLEICVAGSMPLILMAKTSDLTSDLHSMAMLVEYRSP
jgi:hypothetical protein